LSSTNDEGDADDANLFERTVRRVTRNKNYKFGDPAFPCHSSSSISAIWLSEPWFVPGDLAKSAAAASTKTIEGAVRTVTKDEDYQFGDISKKVLSTGTGSFESAVKSITGNEEYKFGVSMYFAFLLR
jgi:hypothetical protein